MPECDYKTSLLHDLHKHRYRKLASKQIKLNFTYALNVPIYTYAAKKQTIYRKCIQSSGHK